MRKLFASLMLSLVIASTTVSCSDSKATDTNTVRIKAKKAVWVATNSRYEPTSITLFGEYNNMVSKGDLIIMNNTFAIVDSIATAP